MAKVLEWEATGGIGLSSAVLVEIPCWGREGGELPEMPKNKI